MKTIFNSPSDLVFQIPGGSPLIQVSNLVKTFRTTSGSVTVLKNINAEIYPGEFVSIVGRSGSGKSTLLNMLTGIDHPTSGKVSIGGTQLYELSESQRASWRGRNMGIVFQFFQLMPMLTLVENVMLPMDFCEIYAPADRETRAMALLSRVGLQGFEHKLPGAVSGGQQQSAAVARALATDPPILLADEPTGNLDSRTAEQIIALFQELIGQRKTIVMVTHDAILAQQTQRSMILADGVLIHPTLVAEFPKSDHDLLLKLNALAQPVSIPAGVEIDTSIQLAIVVSGTLEARPSTFISGAMMRTRQYGAAQPVDLAALRRAGQILRSGSKGPLEILSLDVSALRHLMENSAKGGQD